MRIWLLLFLGFYTISTQAQNLESVLSINEVGLEATFSTFDFDEDGNLYVALNLGFTDREDSSQFVILNYSKGRDTFYYQYKKRIYLLKLSPKGKLSKLRLDIEDGLDYDFFHELTDLKIRDKKLYCIIPKILRTQNNYTINGVKPSVENDTCLHYLNIMTFNQKLGLENVLAYGFDGTNAIPDFFEINNTLLLNIETTINLGNDQVYGEAKYLIGENGDLNLLSDNFDFNRLSNPEHAYTTKNDTTTFYKRSLVIDRFKTQKVLDFRTNSFGDKIRTYGMISNTGKENIYFGNFSYSKRYVNDSLLHRQYVDTPFYEQHLITDFFDEPDSTSFSIRGSLFGFKPDLGKIHWLMGVNIFGYPIENGDSVSFFARVYPPEFKYQFRTDTFIKKPFSETTSQLALFNVKFDGTLNYKYISNIRYGSNPLNFTFSIDESSFKLNNGALYFTNNSTNFPDTVKLDSVTGFKYNPNKAIVRYQLFSPPKHVPDILFTQKDCGSGLLEFKSKDAEHYTVLIANDTIRDFPKSGKNYNYSPNYLQAPKLTNEVKILYQGPDTSLSITNLVSGRKYFVAVVPGNGLPGKTLYNPDSTAFIEFTLTISTTPKPEIFPKIDTSLCASDTIYTKALTLYKPRWMDGKAAFERFVAQVGSYSYTIKDSNNCIVSSDTVLIEKRPNPRIDSIYTLELEPFCLGDTISIVAATNRDLIWSTGSRDKSIKVDTNGTYKVAAGNAFGCSDSAQITIEFQPKPFFYFLLDSIIAIDGKTDIDFKTNAAKTDFIYQNDTFSSANIVFSQDGTLKANAFANSGCSVSDSMLIKVLESQPEIFPNAFSPNNDGLNDEWYFIHPDSAGTLIIYDRWGGIVHHGINHWDGKKNGESLPVDAYRYTFIPSKGEVKRGLIFLVK